MLRNGRGAHHTAGTTWDSVTRGWTYTRELPTPIKHDSLTARSGRAREGRSAPGSLKIDACWARSTCAIPPRAVEFSNSPTQCYNPSNVQKQSELISGIVPSLVLFFFCFPSLMVSRFQILLPWALFRIFLYSICLEDLPLFITLVSIRSRRRREHVVCLFAAPGCVLGICEAGSDQAVNQACASR